MLVGRSTGSKAEQIYGSADGTLSHGDDQQIQDRTFEEVMLNHEVQEVFEAHLHQQNDQVELILNLPNEEKLRASIYSLNGNLMKELYTGSLEASGLQGKSFSTQHLPTGFYFIRVLYADQQKVLKFMVQ